MQHINLKSISDKTLAIIMGGGAGTRLFPLTKERAKPAVPLGGKYRLVDIPISNCLNSGFRQVYVLTQFNSESLHRHITASYKFDNFTKSFVEMLAAQQTPEGASWYQGTADAVRQNLRHFLNRSHEHFLILSGDQLYRMDYLRPAAGAPAHRSRHHPGHHARGQTGGFGFRHHAERCRSTHLSL